MLETRMNPNSKSLFRLTSRLLCLLALLAVAGWVNTTTSKASDRFSCVMSDDGYRINILSCGSSAGNFLYHCYPDGYCGADTDPTNQTAADLTCADYAQNGGCPNDSGGDGGDDGDGEIME